MSESTKMRVIRIVEGTSVDGPGLRTSIYFAGCRHHCPGCHNEHTWDFSAGRDMSVEEVMKTVAYNEAPVTFSGGDPLYQAEAIAPLAEAIKELGLGLWCYTGFTYEELAASHAASIERLLKSIDVLVDGPYIAGLHDPGLLFRGSSNQRLIDVQASLRQGAATEYVPEDTGVHF